MANSAMSTDAGIPSTRINSHIKLTLQRLDEILRDNFKLKQEIACEKKRYVDLMNAFLELRHEQKLNSQQLSDSSQIFDSPKNNFDEPNSK